MTKKVYVGMSGGVDSSVTAALLKEQGYEVTGVYMKNWSQDLPGMKCPWKEDYQDAKRVAVQLGIPFKMYDFEKQYRQKVVDYMVREYQAGRTPNPDVMCNQEVKFKLFLETALEDGADMIATGHYARIGTGNWKLETGGAASAAKQRPIPSSQLQVAKNEAKDQTYFLYRVNSEALSKSLMPIGEFTTKDEVRAIAKKLGLATAGKKDSQGICFVGKVGIKDFLLAELGEQPHGAIIDQNGKTIGEHDGAIYYTIGQRHGLGVGGAPHHTVQGGGLPYYVVGKDMAKNEVYVTTDLQDARLWHDELILADVHWIGGPEGTRTPDLIDAKDLAVRTRYRAPLVPVKSVEKLENGSLKVKLAEEIRALTPGQSAVFYDNETCRGGGIVI